MTDVRMTASEFDAILWSNEFVNDSLIDDHLGNYLEHDLDEEDESFRLFIAALVIGSALLGILTNIFVMAVSVKCIRGDYRHFIANLAFVDTLCAALFAFMGYLNLGNTRHLPISVMTYSAFAFYGSFGVMICALLPISFSRIIAASRPKVYEKLFAGNRALFFCFVSDVAPVALLAAICTSRHGTAKWMFIGYSALTIGAYLVTFMLNILVFRFVAKHIKVVESLHDRTRLIETRQVALATLAQAIVPLLCQVPAFLTLSSALLLVKPLTNGNIIVITQLWLAASPLFDALITIFIIKQYRLHTLAFFSQLFKIGQCLRRPLQRPSLTEFSCKLCASPEEQQQSPDDEEFL